MKQKVQTTTREERESIQILAQINGYDREIKEQTERIKILKATRDNLIWQAQQKNITRAGNYELVPVVKIIRSIDMATMWQWKEHELIQKITKVSLIDAERVFGKDRLEEVIIKTPTISYKVKRLSMEENEDL